MQIVVRNRSTGFTVGAQTREDGRYRVQNLEVGGPYSVTARRIGLQPQTLDNQQFRFPRRSSLDFHLSAQVATLAAVEVTGVNAGEFSPTHTGTRTTISDSVLLRVPTTSRNVTDFVKIAPADLHHGPGRLGGRYVQPHEQRADRRRHRA